MDPLAAQYAKARKLVSTIEFQLQQLEERHAPSADAADVDPRQALAENVNRLHAEVATLERVVQEQCGAGIAATGQKAQLWQK